MVSLGSSGCTSSLEPDCLVEEFDDSDGESNVEMLIMSYKTMYPKWTEDAQVLDQCKCKIEHLI